MIDILNNYKRERSLEEDVTNEDLEHDPMYKGFKDASNNLPKCLPLTFSSRIFYNVGYTLGNKVREKNPDLIGVA